MIPSARGILKLAPEFQSALDQLEGFSHLWLIYVFHTHLRQPWRPHILSPRVDAPKEIGVFASRSPHRPNPIGLSVVELLHLDRAATNGPEIHVGGVDILDETPMLDIKPYLPYADSIPQARAGWAAEEIQKYPVSFSPASAEKIRAHSSALLPNFQTFLAETLAWDPRPISQRQTMPLASPQCHGKIFRFRVAGFDVEWQATDNGIQVLDLFPLT